ncbi:MAG TPA: MFS transporter [Tepidisphaeraceae bacterium]|nr:MFS transporter [Tepidisphaeraceae bacterium]
MSGPTALDDIQTDPPAAPKGAVFTIFLIVAIDLLGVGLIIPLLPFYAKHYDASPLQVELLFSVYSLCQFIAAPILGLISDRFGRRPVLILSQIGSVLGYILLGWATDYPWANPMLGLTMIYISRVIDGLSGGNISTAQAYIADVTTSENRARSMGLLGAAFGLGFAFGPAIGGALGHFDPSWPAYTAAAFSAVAAILTFVKLKESRIHRPAEAEAWLHPGNFVPILKKPVLLQLLLIWFVSMAAYMMMDASAAMFLNDVFGFKELQVGLYFMFIGIIIAIVQGGVIRKLDRKYSEWSLAAIGVLCVSIGAFSTLTTAWKPLLWLLGLGGIVHAGGRSLQQPTISSLVSKHAGKDEQGATMGLFQGLGSLARTIGPVIGGIAYQGASKVEPTRPYITASVLLLGTTIWTWGVKRMARE